MVDQSSSGLVCHAIIWWWKLLALSRAFHQIPAPPTAPHPSVSIVSRIATSGHLVSSIGLWNDPAASCQICVFLITIVLEIS